MLEYVCPQVKTRGKSCIEESGGAVQCDVCATHEIKNTGMLTTPMRRGHVFEIHLGDWSGDGHGLTEKYRINSNKPVAEVREAFYKAVQTLPPLLNPTKFCNAYEDSELPADVRAAALKAGFAFSESLTPDELLTYVLWFICKGDVTLQLAKLENERVDTLHFYGDDEKNRHIDFFGYGLFE